MRTARWLAVASAALGGGCKSGVFECRSDAQCESGVWQATGYCSVPDGDCPSGQRYGQFAPSELAGECVPEGSEDDAAATGGVLTGSDGATTTMTATDGSTSTVLDDSGGTTAAPGTTSGAASTGGVATSTTGASESSTGEPQVCPALVDDFEDGVIAPFWITSDPEFTSEVGGHIVFTIDPPAGPFPDVALDSSYDLSSGWFRAELAEVVPTIAVQSYLRLGNANDDNEYVVALIEGSVLIARHGVDGGGASNFVSTMFDPDEHRWLQIRGEGDTMHFETSADGVTFESYASPAAPFSMAAVIPGVGSGNWAAISETVTASFESVALCTDDALN